MLLTTWGQELVDAVQADNGDGVEVSRFFAQEGIDSFSALAALVVLTPVEPQTLDQVQIPSCGGLLPPEMGPRLREGTLGPCSATEQAHAAAAAFVWLFQQKTATGARRFVVAEDVERAASAGRGTVRMPRIIGSVAVVAPPRGGRIMAMPDEPESFAKFLQVGWSSQAKPLDFRFEITIGRGKLIVRDWGPSEVVLVPLRAEDVKVQAYARDQLGRVASVSKFSLALGSRNATPPHKALEQLVALGEPDLLDATVAVLDRCSEFAAPALGLAARATVPRNPSVRAASLRRNRACANVDELLDAAHAILLSSDVSEDTASVLLSALPVHVRTVADVTSLLRAYESVAIQALRRLRPEPSWPFGEVAPPQTIIETAEVSLLGYAKAFDSWAVHIQLGRVDAVIPSPYQPQTVCANVPAIPTASGALVPPSRLGCTVPAIHGTRCFFSCAPGLEPRGGPVECIGEDFEIRDARCVDPREGPEISILDHTPPDTRIPLLMTSTFFLFLAFLGAACIEASLRWKTRKSLRERRRIKRILRLLRRLVGAFGCILVPVAFATLFVWSSRWGACNGPGTLLGDGKNEKVAFERLLCARSGSPGFLYRPTTAVLEDDLCDFTCPAGTAARGGRLLCYDGVLATDADCARFVTAAAEDVAAGEVTINAMAAAAAAGLDDVCAPFGGPGVIAAASNATLGDPTPNLPVAGQSFSVWYRCGDKRLDVFLTETNVTVWLPRPPHPDAWSPVLTWANHPVIAIEESADNLARKLLFGLPDPIFEQKQTRIGTWGTEYYDEEVCAAYDGHWRLDLCTLTDSAKTLTHAECTCSRPGTYAVVVKRTFFDVLEHRTETEEVPWSDVLLPIHELTFAHLTLFLFTFLLLAILYRSLQKDLAMPAEDVVPLFLDELDPPPDTFFRQGPLLIPSVPLFDGLYYTPEFRIPLPSAQPKKRRPLAMSNLRKSAFDATDSIRADWFALVVLAQANGVKVRRLSKTSTLPPQQTRSWRSTSARLEREAHAVPRLRRGVIAAIMELAEEIAFAPPPEKVPPHPREILKARERFRRQLLGGTMVAYASAKGHKGENDTDLVPLHGFRKWEHLLVGGDSATYRFLQPALLHVAHLLELDWDKRKLNRQWQQERLEKLTHVMEYRLSARQRLAAITNEEGAKPSRALWAGPLASFLVVATQEEGKRTGRNFGELRVGFLWSSFFGRLVNFQAAVCHNGKWELKEGGEFFVWPAEDAVVDRRPSPAGVADVMLEARWGSDIWTFTPCESKPPDSADETSTPGIPAPLPSLVPRMQSSLFSPRRPSGGGNLLVLLHGEDEEQLNEAALSDGSSGVSAQGEGLLREVSAAVGSTKEEEVAERCSSFCYRTEPSRLCCDAEVKTLGPAGEGSVGCVMWISHAGYCLSILPIGAPEKKDEVPNCLGIYLSDVLVIRCEDEWSEYVDLELKDGSVLIIRGGSGVPVLQRFCELTGIEVAPKRVAEKKKKRQGSSLEDSEEGTSPKPLDLLPDEISTDESKDGALSKYPSLAQSVTEKALGLDLNDIFSGIDATLAEIADKASKEAANRWATLRKREQRLAWLRVMSKKIAQQKEAAEQVQAPPLVLMDVESVTTSTNGWLVPSAFLANQSDIDPETSKKGRLVVEVVSASGLANADITGGPDPYVVVHVQTASRPAAAEVWKTRVIDDTFFPIWMQQKSFDVDATLYPVWVLFRLMDHDLLSKDDVLGEVAVAAPVGNATRILNIEVPLATPKNEAGTCGFLRATLVWDPAAKAKSLSDGTAQAVQPESLRLNPQPTLTGTLRVHVMGGRSIYNLSEHDQVPSAVVALSVPVVGAAPEQWRSKPVHNTRPYWDDWHVFDINYPPDQALELSLEVWDDRPSGEFAVLGDATVEFSAEPTEVKRTVQLSSDGEVDVVLLWQPAFDTGYRTPMELYKRTRAQYLKALDVEVATEEQVAETARKLMWLGWTKRRILRYTRLRVFRQVHHLSNRRRTALRAIFVARLAVPQGVIAYMLRDCGSWEPSPVLCGQEGWNTYDLELPFTYEAVLLGLFAAACALPVAEILASLLYRRPVHEKISESEKRWRRVRFVLSDIVGAVGTVVVVATSVYYSAVWLGRTGRSTSAARKSWIFAGFVATIAQVVALPVVASWVWMLLLVAARNVGVVDWLLLLFPFLLVEAEDASKPGFSSLSSSERLLDSMFDAEEQLDNALFDAAETAGAILSKGASSIAKSHSMGPGASGFRDRQKNKLVGDIVDEAGIENAGRVVLGGAAGDDARENQEDKKGTLYGKSDGGVTLGSIPSYA
jgi:hypothetical protein